MPKILVNFDLNKNQIQNALAHVLGSDPGTPSAGQFWYRSDTGLLSFQNASVAIRLGRLDQITAPTASVSLNSQTITNHGTPSSPTDAATKGYVDGLTGAGVSWKSPARAATTAAGTLATSFANGQVIDGVTLATGDRILVKDQAAGAENGIYTVNASGAPTRATDSDTDTELRQAALFIQEGTANADSAWVNTVNGAITVNTTALTFVQFSGLGQITAGAGLTKTGNTLDVVGTAARITVNANDIDIAATYVGQTSITTLGTVTTGTWSATAVDVAHGGTGRATLTTDAVLTGNGTGLVNMVAGTANQVLRITAGTTPAFGAVDLATAMVTGTLPLANGGGYTSAATAKTALLFPTVFAADVGDGSTTSIVVTHSLGTKDVLVSLWDKTTPFAEVIADVQHTSTTTITLVFAVAPTSAQYRVVVVG